MKKDYLQPIIEIEYYQDVILCEVNVNDKESHGNFGSGDTVWDDEL